MRVLWVIIATLMVMTVGCSKNPSDPPVPRRQAFPRIDIPVAQYTPVDIGNHRLFVNSAIDSIQEDGEGWLTLSYSRGLATIYITATSLEGQDVDKVIDNRVERLSLNTGGAPTEVVSVPNEGGYDARLIVTPHSSPTPVQFIATDHDRVMISGSALVPGIATATTDSLQPVVEMLRRDLSYMLSRL